MMMMMIIIIMQRLTRHVSDDESQANSIASLCMTSSWRHCKYFQAWKFWIFNSMQL